MAGRMRALAVSPANAAAAASAAAHAARLASIAAVLVGALSFGACNSGAEPKPGADTVRAAIGASGQSPAEEPGGEAGEAGEAASTPDGLQRTVLTVEGLYCTSCERTVAAMLTRTPGVVRAQVSAKRGEAVVLYDPARTSAPKLVAVLQRLGYRAAAKPT